jgi:hypothetical protein
MVRRILFLVLLAVAVAGALTWSLAADKPSAPVAVKAEPNIVDRLARRIDFAGIDDPKATLREALELLGKNSGLAFDVNEAAFKSESIENVLSREFGEQHIPKMKNVTVERVLRKLLSRIPSASGATFMIRREAIEITTGAAQATEVWPMGYTGPRLPLVSAAFDKKPLNEALKDLARQSGMNVVVDARVAEKAKSPVSARFLNTPLDTAVRILADMADLKPYPVDNLLYVTTPANANRLAERPKIEDPEDGSRIGNGPGRRPATEGAGM